MPKRSWWINFSAAFLFCAATTRSSPAQTFTTLMSFNGTDGSNPAAALIQATNGELYGTTLYGGVGEGTIFKATPMGTLTTLNTLSGFEDGHNPNAALVEGGDGSFYGTATTGGGSNTGAIFKMTPQGALKTLVNFSWEATPQAGLIQATDGDFYGTTTYGGGNDQNCVATGGHVGCGTVFKSTSAGALSVLHSFDGTDGAYPVAGLIQGVDGNFYGTTEGGGGTRGCYIGDYGPGCGTVFKMTPSGAVTTLHMFCSEGPPCADGAVPAAALVQASDGNFYGTTSGAGGASGPVGSYGAGTVFRITADGTFTTLHTFDGIHGEDPQAGLVQASDGNLYGTTAYGGAHYALGGYQGHGTIFKITLEGTLTTLHNFDPQGAGSSFSFIAGLVQATNGNFYGTTYYGQDNRYGTIFRFNVGLGPFVKTLPTSGKVAAAVKISGTNLSSTTRVTFNGTAAVFTVGSPSLITTIVPTGATTGTVQVVTPSGTLSSIGAFRVTQ